MDVVKSQETEGFLNAFDMICQFDKSMRPPTNIPLSKKNAQQVKKTVYFCEKI